MLRDSSIRCTTSLCALPMINMGYLDRDWYEGFVQKVKWKVPIRETDAADIEAFTSRNLLRNRGVQVPNGNTPAGKSTDGLIDGKHPDAIGPVGKNTVSNDELPGVQGLDGSTPQKKKEEEKVTAGTGQSKL